MNKINQKLRYLQRRSGVYVGKSAERYLSGGDEFDTHERMELQ